MPTFHTPEPVRAELSLAFGETRIVAGDRTDTVVEVLPRDRFDPADALTADRTDVEYSDGTLRVTMPDPRVLSGGGVVILIWLPTGSGVFGDAMAADFRLWGELGTCRIATGLGRITLDRAHDLDLTATLGDIVVERVTGHVEARADCGSICIREIHGGARIRTDSVGDIMVGNARGPVLAETDSGEIHILWAHSGVEARTTQGDIRLGEVVRGSVTVDTSCGDIDIGIAHGTTVDLGLNSPAGTVYQSLALLEEPEPSEETVSVRAHTHIGDIVVHRTMPDESD
jgi:hypothetical protein